MEIHPRWKPSANLWLLKRDSRSAYRSLSKVRRPVGRAKPPQLNALHCTPSNDRTPMSRSEPPHPHPILQRKFSSVAWILNLVSVIRWELGCRWKSRFWSLPQQLGAQPSLLQIKAQSVYFSLFIMPPLISQVARCLNPPVKPCPGHKGNVTPFTIKMNENMYKDLLWSWQSYTRVLHG